MQFRRGAHIYDVDDQPIGAVTHVVLDPDTKTATHVVVRRGMIARVDRVVPIEWLQAARLDRVTLQDDVPDWHNLPRFEQPCYELVEVSETDAGYLIGTSGNMYLNPSVDFFPENSGEVSRTPRPKRRYITRTRQNIPEGTVALEVGARVMGKEGHCLGHVDSIVIDSETARLLHVRVVGRMWSRSHRVVLADEMGQICPDVVYLYRDENMFAPHHHLNAV